MRAGGEELDSGPLGEAVGAHRLEDVACRFELFAGVTPPFLPSEPLAVDQLAACEVQPRTACVQLSDRLAVVRLGPLVVGEQRLAPRQETQVEKALVGTGPLFEVRDGS